MNLLIISVYYPPVISSLAVMMEEVAKYLHKKGHKVSVATVKPHSGLNLVKTDKQIDFQTYSLEDGVEVIRVPTPPLKSKSLLIRGFVQLLLPHIFFWKINKYMKEDFDVVMISTPPLHLTKLGKIFKKKHKSKFLLFVQDIYPESLVDIGAINNKRIVQYFKNIAEEGYKNADLLSSHTRGNRRFIIDNYKIDSDKIHFLPNWIDCSPYEDIKDYSYFRKKYNLENKFIFLFAGILGLGQGLENLIQAIVSFKKFPKDCIFLIVGNGSEKETLVKLAENTDNIIFKPFVSLEEYPLLAKSVDMGIICLDSRLSTPVVPGKLLGFMAAAIPVVALLNRESDGHHIIKSSKCGFSIRSDDSHENIYLMLMKAYHSKETLKEMGFNGYSYVKEVYNKQNCLKKIDYLMNSIAD